MEDIFVLGQQAVPEVSVKAHSSALLLLQPQLPVLMMETRAEVSCSKFWWKASNAPASYLPSPPLAPSPPREGAHKREGVAWLWLARQEMCSAWIKLCLSAPSLPLSFVPASKPWHGPASSSAPSLVHGRGRVPSADTSGCAGDSGAVFPGEKNIIFKFLFFFFASCCRSNRIPPPWQVTGAGRAAVGRTRPLAGEGPCWLPSACSGSGGHSAGAGRQRGPLCRDIPAAAASPLPAAASPRRQYSKPVSLSEGSGSIQQLFEVSKESWDIS